MIGTTWWMAGLAIVATGPLAQLDALERSIDALEHRRQEIETQRALVQEQLATVTTDLATSRAKRETALSRFRRRLQALHQMPTGARLAVLGGAHSLADYLDVTRVLRWVAREDHSLQDRYLKESERLRNLEAALDMHERNIETLDSQARSQQARLTAQRRDRLDLLRQLSMRRELAAEARAERDKAASNLYRMVARLTPLGHQDARFATNRGRLPWPAVGPIATHFGLQTDADNGAVTMANGITIRAPSGVTVQAVADGTVVYADWFAAYGQVVIVQHGEDYYTLVAHLAAVNVHAGDAVSIGAVVGTVGETGSLEGPALYFEIRQGATPVEPEAWLRR